MADQAVKKGVMPSEDARISYYNGEVVKGTCPAYDISLRMQGELILTNYRIIFLPALDSQAPFQQQFPNQMIYQIKVTVDQDTLLSSNRVKPPLNMAQFKTTSHSSHIPTISVVEKYIVYLIMKDIRQVAFGLYMTEDPNARLDVNLCHDFLEMVYNSAFPTQDQGFFAFHFTPQLKEWETSFQYDPIQDFTRQGVLNPCSNWRISTINEAYSLCATYPKLFVVPSSISDADLLAVAKFRSKGRIPVLSYKHPLTQASLTRCAQPLIGIKRARSVDDEHLLQAILMNNPLEGKLMIVDIRPKVNALANHAAGAGFENSNYKNCEVVFLNVGNVHAMRDGWNKLRRACLAPEEPKFASYVDQSNWLDYIKLILDGTNTVVRYMDKDGFSVLTHCSDGWDRTSQICALVQICLDSHYRTLEGFMNIIEKEWLYMGHKIHQRSGHGDHNTDFDQRAPIFLQFLECVWHIMQQFPHIFEFTEHLLLFLADQHYTCLFGTFLGNNTKAREEMKLQERTVSIWAYILTNKYQFISPLFVPYRAVIVPCTLKAKLRLWDTYYLRYALSSQAHVLENRLYIPADRADVIEEKYVALNTQLAALSIPQADCPPSS